MDASSPTHVQPMVEQSVAIFSSREDVETLHRTIDATRRALKCASACIDVVINGNQSLAEAIQLRLNEEDASARAAGNRPLRIWFVAMGDKAHAWNEYVRRIWPKSQLAFFVDGYARPHEDSLQAIASGLANNAKALGATAVPTCGMSAKSQREMLRKDGGIQGNLYAVQGNTLKQLTESGFGLPRGIYRTDPLLAAVLCFNLDPANNPWDPEMMHVEWAATWDYEPLKWWRPSDLLTHFRRTRRQKQGVLENAAVKQWLAVEKRPPGLIPATVQELVSDWIRRCPDDACKLIGRTRSYRAALANIMSHRDWSAATIPPTMFGQHSF